MSDTNETISVVSAMISVAIAITVGASIFFIVCCICLCSYCRDNTGFVAIPNTPAVETEMRTMPEHPIEIIQIGSIGACNKGDPGDIIAVKA